ncbi:MAG: hypothetical protein GY756_27530 [bacterium]|nr:hypothetical protein [bacterium]
MKCSYCKKNGPHKACKALFLQEMSSTVFMYCSFPAGTVVCCYHVMRFSCRNVCLLLSCNAFFLQEKLSAVFMHCTFLAGTVDYCIRV